MFVHTFYFSLWRRAWQPALVFLPGESHGQRTLGGYSPKGCKELDTTEQLGTHKHPFVISYMWILKMQQSSELKIHSQM